MKNLTTKSLLLLAFAFSGLMFTSCAEEDIVGCTDTEASNYDATATVSGDCIYDRDQFLGDYIGTMTCQGGLAMLLDNDNLTFTISEGVGTDKSQVTIALTGGVPVSFSGTVSGNTLSVSQAFTNLPLVLGGNPINVDMNVGGAVTYMEMGMSVGGDLLITEIMSSDTGSTLVPDDSCAMTGVKQ